MKKGLLILSGVLGASILALTLLIIIYLGKQNTPGIGESGTVQNDNHNTGRANAELPVWAVEFEKTIVKNYLPINAYSRPGTTLSEVNGVVVHYVGNPNTTAEQNRSYFNNLAQTHETKASSHFIIGLDGEIIQCVPLDEIAYASNSRNDDTISIECCHPDSTGKFNAATEETLIKLTAYICLLYDLNPTTDVIRHYDVTGKQCPKYYVDNEDLWVDFKASVKEKIENGK